MTIDRRRRIDLATPGEKAIRDARDEVEKLGADKRLTDIVILLGQALEKLSDYIDGVP